MHDQLAVALLIFAIAAAGWVNTRTVRGDLVERNKEYVQAARVIGHHPWRHVRACCRTRRARARRTLQIGAAIITESLSPRGRAADTAIMGTLIRIGNDFLFSGEWWITVFPGAALVILVSINVLRRLAARRAEPGLR